MYYDYDISDRVIEKAEQAEQDCREIFAKHEQISLCWSSRILKAFQKHNVSSADFIEITGYGYDDIGRDTLERVYARIFHTEAALMRPHVASGTAALSLTLSGLTHPGDHILSVTGMPYDTLQSVIGIGNRPHPGSLKEYCRILDKDAEGAPEAGCDDHIVECDR